MPSLMVSGVTPWSDAVRSALAAAVPAPGALASPPPPPPAAAPGVAAPPPAAPPACPGAAVPADPVAFAPDAVDERPAAEPRPAATVPGFGSLDASGIRKPASSIPTMTPRATRTSRSPAGNRRIHVLPPHCPSHNGSGIPSAKLAAGERPLHFLVTPFSCDDAAYLQVDDRVPVDPEIGEDRVAVLVEIRRTLRSRRLFVVLHGRSRELERSSVRGRAIEHVAVGNRLRVDARFERVLHRGPLPGELAETVAPLVEGALGERLGDQLPSRGAVLDDRRRVGEAVVVRELGTADDLACLGPVARRLQAAQRDVAFILGAVRV